MSTQLKGHYSDVWQAIARALPDRPAIVTKDETLSYGRFRDEAASLAQFLTESGVAPHDSLAILMYNRPEYLVGFFACFATGIVPVPINYRYRAGEVAELLLDSDVSALMYPSSLAEVVSEAQLLVGKKLVLIEIDDSASAGDSQSSAESRAVSAANIMGATRYRDIVASPGSLPEHPPEGGDLRLYTGGTTGRPKAVVWGTEDIFDVQLFSIYEAGGIRYPRDMDDAVVIAEDPSTPHIVTLPLAPFMHGTALFTSINTLVIGGTVVIHASPKLDADEAVRIAVAEGVTRIIVAGDAVAIPLIDAVERAGLRQFGSVSSMISSGMRFSDNTKERIHRHGTIKIIDLLAATEGGPFAACITESVGDLPGRLKRMPGGVVLDENQNEVQGTIGARGLLAFNGTLPKGYFGDPEKTAATFPVIRGKRHVIPGDWAVVLEGDCIELLGRGSAVVNTGGEKVYPLEVEEALLSHPAVIDAVVFGMPDDRFGEVVTAIVVLHEGAEVSESALMAHVDQSLAGYKKPKRIFQLPSLNRSPHGKVDMKQLKAEISSDYAKGAH